MAKNNQKSQGVKLAIRQAGEGGITKQELNNITKTTGASAQTVVQRLDQVNKNLQSKDAARIGLNSGAANMLIKQNSKNPVGMFNQGQGFGSGQIGKALTSMMGTPASRGYTSKGQTMGANAGTPAQMMIGGTQIRGGGRVAVKGFGKQYTYGGGTGGAGPYDGMEIPEFNPNGPGPLAPTQSIQPDPVIEDPVVEDPVTTTTDPGSGMLSGGGAGAAGANKLGRAKSRLRQLGIYGRGTGLLGRGLQYGNALNA